MLPVKLRTGCRSRILHVPTASGDFFSTYKPTTNLHKRQPHYCVLALNAHHHRFWSLSNSISLNPTSTHPSPSHLTDAVDTYTGSSKIPILVAPLHPFLIPQRVSPFAKTSPRPVQSLHWQAWPRTMRFDQSFLLCPSAPAFNGDFFPGQMTAGRNDLNPPSISWDFVTCTGERWRVQNTQIALLAIPLDSQEVSMTVDHLHSRCSP
ncbi:hypothetical protein DFH09DRAFT_1085586 [Mycena vulgaris]|nr:hypothetical protein DFH09DRAFT_1085586 [Mycena vulgaris]